MSRVVAPPVAAPPAALANGPVQVSVATGAAGFLTVGALWLAARYGPRQGALLLVGAALGLTLHHAVFGFTAAYRALVTVGDGRGVRAQLLMLAVATVLFAPSLAESLGWAGAVVLQLAACALLALVSWTVERRRVDARSSLPVPVTGWRRVVQGPWPLGVGAVLLALLNLVTLVVAGTPWSITWAFALWGAKALVAMGYDLSGVAFWSGEFQPTALAAPILAAVTSVMDLGLVLGALLGAGLAGRFAPRRRVPARRVAAAVLGGLLLGYGSRIAYGCNIGALFGGIASTSLHGWVWAGAAVAGTPLGVRLRGRFRAERAAPAGVNAGP